MLTTVAVCLVLVACVAISLECDLAAAVCLALFFATAFAV